MISLANILMAVGISFGNNATLAAHEFNHSDGIEKSTLIYERGNYILIAK
jgi:hypothetical protein